MRACSGIKSVVRQRLTRFEDCGAELVYFGFGSVAGEPYAQSAVYNVGGQAHGLKHMAAAPRLQAEERET